MAEELNIITSDSNTVNVNTEDRIVTITNDSDATTVTLSAAETTTIQIATIGPQGPKGDTGNIDISTLSTTGSNNFVGNQTITGSLTVSGSSTFTNIGPAIFSGSINTTNGISGSLYGTASWAYNASQSVSSSFASTASYALNAGAGAGFPYSGSAVITGSLYVTQGITGSFSGSMVGYVTNEATASFIINSQTSSFVTTSSFNSFITSTNNFTQSILTWTGSVATTESFNYFTSSINNFTQSINNQTGSFAITGSNVFRGNQTITGSLTISGSTTTPLRIQNAFTFGTNASVTSGEIKSLLTNADFLGIASDAGTFNFYGGGAYNTGAGITVGGRGSSTFPNVVVFWRDGFIQSGRFTTNGNLILGTSTTDAGFKLDVSGSTRLNGNTTITGSKLISGSLTVTGSTNLFVGTGTTVLSSNADTLTITGSLIVTGSSIMTGSLVVTNGITGSLSGSVFGYVANTSTGSFIINSQTASFTTTSSFSSFTSSINNFTESINNWTGSVITNLQTGSMLSPYALATQLNSYLTTGSSNGSQTLEGSLTINQNLIVLGSQSIQHITSSQLNIGTNLITVNTGTPAVRFGGLSVIDSGSTGTGLTGSILWDSQNNIWIYSNPSGSNYDGAMILVGPRNYTGIGNEQAINKGYAAVGDGSHHMTSSQIYNSGSLIRLETDTQITGGLNVSQGITGSLLGTAATASYLNPLNQSAVLTGSLNVFSSSLIEDLFQVTGKVGVSSASISISPQSITFQGQAALGGHTLRLSFGGLTGPGGPSDIYFPGNANGVVIPVYINNIGANDYGEITLDTIPTASFVTASNVIGTVLSASYSDTASFAPNYVLNSTTGSMLQPYLQSSETGSFVLNSQTSSFVTNSQTSSFVTNSQTGSFILNSQTGSMYVASASWATNALTASEVIVTNTTTGVGPYYVTFTSNTGSDQPILVDSNGLLFNVDTNVLTTTASFAQTASFALNSGAGGISQGKVVAIVSGLSNLF